MAVYQLLILTIFTTLLLSTHAGPAGQMAMAAAARASKIPRAIRASFRNPEIGVARGFGKRGGGNVNFKESKSLRTKRFSLFGIFGDHDVDERIRRGRAGIKFKLNDRELRISRGFGKRSISTNDVPWSYRKDDGGKLMEENEEPFQQLVREVQQDGIPIDWLANEMSGNPYLARIVLHRLVDSNRDGILTANEVLPNDEF